MYSQQYDTMEAAKLRAIAFYLPQYHPIPENDIWWGKGFTEWANVVKAKPRFKGHYQPHLPADLGFYDLRLPETRAAQADLARAYGIHGFCYYHYWFNGKRLLERPFDEVLNSGEPDFPFCLCWANENWTRRWDGAEQEILMQQVYDEASDRKHLQWLAQAFADPRYIRVDGKPLFLVYRASQIPNPAKTVEVWREEAQRLGIGELFLVRVESSASEHTDPVALGFDAAVEFQPDWTQLGPALQRKGKWKWRRKLGLSEQAYGNNRIYNYQSMVERMLNKAEPPYLRLPCITPAWDNAARRKDNATIIHGSTPALYGNWLKSVTEKLVKNQAQKGLLFINAWNEWAEGNHLEPCQKWGNAYLEQTRQVLNEYARRLDHHSQL